MLRVIINIEGHMCICCDTYVTIVDSHQVPECDIPRFISKLRAEINNSPKLKDLYKRSEESWIKEWIAHNRLYKRNLFVDHTKDVDLDEKESLFRLFCYQFIGRPKKKGNTN
jgi:hypothetical protein